MLKPADFFDNNDILYLMEDMATGEIRLSILWEWLHKGATLTEDDLETQVQKGDVFDIALFSRLLDEEYKKLLEAKHSDVHDDSKKTTLPISRVSFSCLIKSLVCNLSFASSLSRGLYSSPCNIFSFSVFMEMLEILI